ncbi:MAG: hypothetical protein ACM3X7_05970 [Solirubrobacterales bacterium]
MKKNYVILCLFIAVLFAGAGFITGQNINSREKVNPPENGDIVDIKVTYKQSGKDGTSYTIVVKNISKYIIKQNSFYVSYPIKYGSSHTMNKCKAETTGNKLNIKPNEEVTLNAFIPIENYKNNENLDISEPDYEMKGYLGEVSEMNHFEESGGFPR